LILAALFLAGRAPASAQGNAAGRARSGVGASAVQSSPLSFKGTIQPFIEVHCVDCHGADTHKAGLRLDTLPPDFRDEKTGATWTHVFDKIISGEMPPKKRERPPQRDIYAVAQFLYTQLQAISLEHQQKKGRVTVRRLNGTEYENTLRDLLGTNVALKEMLPEDSTTAGFDNVSTGLDLSATHFLLYQEAAAKAVQSVIPISPPIPFSDRRTAEMMVKKGPNFQQTMGRGAKMQGDALVFYTKLPRYGLCSTASVQTAGRYRITMSACSVGGDGKPIPAGFMVVNSSGRESPVLREVREIPHGKPQLIEFEFELGRNQAFVMNLLTSWDIRIFKKPIEEYTGPGLLVEWMQVDGPIDAFPPPSYRNLFGDVPLKARSVVKAEMAGTRVTVINEKRPEQQWYGDPLQPASANPKQDAERLIRAFLPRAFRRPVSEDVQKRFVQQVHAKLDQKYSFFDAMMFGYKLILSSPDFLFLMDSPVSNATAQGDLVSPKLDEYSLAERLSYFLWSTLPDDELLAAARKGELGKPATLHAQVERMLNSPRAHRFTENFSGQWLDLRKIDFTIPDPQLYSDFDYLLLAAMPRETQLFFEEVLRNDLSLLSFIDSDWTMLNERLATLYGIPGVTGNDFRKVKLPPDAHRGGVMTQASVLKVTADGTRTSPVLRGKWILERILGKPPAPPPPDVPAIEPDIRGATTIRQQLDKHRNTPACATCHIHIDPPGFALENYDPIGNWRDFYRVTTRTKEYPQALFPTNGRGVYRGLDVEKGGVTPAGKPFKDISDYKKILLEDKDQLARSLTQKLIVYATGADIQFADREVVEQIVAKVKAKNYGFRTLIHEIVQSRVFLNK
jgi:mono/diheme cytochrome c family protein